MVGFTGVSNVDGFNPGPNSASLPDTSQSPIGNLWKLGTFKISLTPASVAATTAVVQQFAATGIGLQVGDSVVVNPPGTTTGAVQAAAYVSATDTLALQFVNPTASAVVPAAGVYTVTVFRIQPNWTAPASGYQFDF